MTSLSGRGTPDAFLGGWRNPSLREPLMLPEGLGMSRAFPVAKGSHKSSPTSPISRLRPFHGDTAVVGGCSLEGVMVPLGMAVLPLIPVFAFRGGG